MHADKGSRFLRALKRQPVDATPIWIMRQAGRYLPEYRKVRAQAKDFMTLCQTPELAAEVTLQPLRRFDLDAAIIFSDILTIPAAMGLDLKFVEGEGPQFSNPIQTLKDIEQLNLVGLEDRLSYVFKAIQYVKPQLKVPLIGFSGSPWTLAAYMIEGQGSRDFQLAKKMMYAEPAWLHQLLTQLTQAIIVYLKHQIQAGADVVMLFDTWGGLLSASAYPLFSLHYMEKIIQALKKEFQEATPPIILFTKNGGQWLELITQSGCDAIGLDWTISLKEARQRVGHGVALQGNLDPAILRASPAVIQKEAQAILQEHAGQPGHIFNLGHGITPDILPEHVHVLVETVHGK